MSSVSGSYSIDWRRDPVDGVFYPEEITAEVENVIILSGTNGRRGFYLIEIPNSNNAVTITRTHYVDGGTGILTPDGSPPTYTQVSSAPNANEYVVNYEQGIIILNSGEYNNTYQLGSRFTVAYYGLGTAMNIRNTQYIENASLATKLSIDGTIAMTGNLNMGSQKIVSLANGTNSNDAINKSQLDSLSNALNALQAGKGGKYYSIFGTQTITEDKFSYYFYGGGSPSLIANITGCPDIDGTVILLGWLAYTTSVAISVHGTSIVSATVNGTAFAFKDGGVWYGVKAP